MSPPAGPDRRAESRREASELRVGIDVGGTFTDFVVRGGQGEIRTHKVLSTPADPSVAVLRGLEELLAEAVPDGSAGAAEARGEGFGGGRRPPGRDGRLSVVHGSTVATNAVLERKGAPTGLVTSEGFRDVLAIGRQRRPDLYDLFPEPARPLVPPERCFEIPERVDARGEEVKPLADEELPGLIEGLRERDVESVAVCLLHAYLRPGNERAVKGALEEAGFRVSVSSEILPEFREYERASTTAVNAYVSPVLDGYLGRLSQRLPTTDVRVMLSSGGSMTVERARSEGVRSILSGPAGGMIGALHVARAAGFERILSFDMGGTSTDVALADGEPRITTEAEIDGLPIGIPVIDLHTVGSGGGSIARVDAGGALRVGPRSAGADPGPVCYGRGGERPTVTDAHVALGRLVPGELLRGQLSFDPDAAERALEDLARRADLPVPERLTPARAAALGILRVTDAHLERALRVISIERGHDPADFTLVAFGGAGGLHACSVARALEIRRVLVPPAAATLSALGMQVADVIVDRARTVLGTENADPEELERRLDDMADRAERSLVDQGMPEERISSVRYVEMRYRGQSYVLRVPFGPDFEQRFHRAHEARYGHADPGSTTEIVNLRVRAVGAVEPPSAPELEAADPDPSAALVEHRPVVLAGSPRAADPSARGVGENGSSVAEPRGREAASAASLEVRDVPFYRGEALRPGHRLRGPAVVTRSDTTVFLPPGHAGEVDPRLNLILEIPR